MMIEQTYCQKFLERTSLRACVGHLRFEVSVEKLPWHHIAFKSIDSFLPLKSTKGKVLRSVDTMKHQG